MRLIGFHNDSEQAHPIGQDLPMHIADHPGLTWNAARPDWSCAREPGGKMTRRRAWVALLIFVAVIINYMDRIALSVAAKPIVAEFGFTPVQMGYLFSGFLWTYVVCLIPLGMLVDRIGAKRMVGGGIAIWSAATAVTAAMGSFGGIIACRLVMGASEATTFPACGRVIRDWFPDR